jgi:RNA polymerase sigma-70 factor (ECF subfamily)
VAAELLADKRYHKAYMRQMYRYKAQYSLDVDNGIENAVILCELSTYEVLERKERFCRLCRALNSLPETQGRRIEARYIRGMSVTAIAQAEGVAKSRISESIERGLRNMKKFMHNLP